MGAPREASGREAWTIAVLLWLAVVGITTYEIAPASVLSLVSADLAVGSTGVSWLVSVFLLGMVVFSLPAGFLLDRRDDRTVILLMALLYVGSTAWAFWASETGAYWSLVGARFVGGAVNVILWTAAVNVVGAVFDRTRQGTGIGFLLTSIPGGFAISHVLTPVLAGGLGWPTSFLVYGGVTAVSALGFWGYTTGIELRIQTTVPDRAAFRTVLSNPWVWAVGGLAFAAFSLNIFFNNWLPTYLVRQFGFSLAQGGVFAAVFPAIGALGRVTSGSLSDRFLGGRRNPIVLGSFLVITPLIVLIATLRIVVVLLIALVIAGFVTQMGLALLLPYARELVAENVTATAIAVLNLVGFIGAFVTPVLTGWLIDQTGAFTVAFGFALAVALLGVVLAWITPEPQVTAAGRG
jgi:nitrate/nitrite transporter NarK